MTTQFEQEEGMRRTQTPRSEVKLRQQIDELNAKVSGTTTAGFNDSLGRSPGTDQEGWC